MDDFINKIPLQHFLLFISFLQAGELEQSDQEITLSLQGMGLSLVNNTVQKEIAYMSIISSGVVWETKKKKRYKALKMKQSTALEAAYQKYQQEILTGGKANPIAKIGKMEVSKISFYVVNCLASFNINAKKDEVEDLV